MKRLLIVGVAIYFMFATTGCDLSQSKDVNSGEGSAVTDTTDANSSQKDDKKDDEKYYITPTDEFKTGEVITAGPIVKFDGKFVHIMCGDVIEVFNYNGESEKFYMHQEVELVKGEKGNYIRDIKKDDYTITHTNMGNMINQIKGEVVSVDDDKLTIKSENQLIEYDNTDQMIDLAKGDEVNIYTISMGDKNVAVYILKDSSKLELIVTKLERDDDGNLNALLKDSDGGKYKMNLSHVSVEFNLGEVKVGDTLIAYYDVIMESDPMQLGTILVRKK